MLLATLAITFNLFGYSFVNFHGQVRAESTETSLSVSQKHSILEQACTEEIDFSETEEDVETETEEYSDDLFTSDHEFFRLLNEYEFPTVASSSPFLKPLRSEEIPIYLAFQNIRL
jgi:hypothetical protein